MRSKLGQCGGGFGGSKGVRCGERFGGDVSNVVKGHRASVGGGGSRTFPGPHGKAALPQPYEQWSLNRPGINAIKEGLLDQMSAFAS
ncbi:hypothetical protein E2C01_017690 [Portunus trituberculatus]|uniref:Uncharacterized protein n=1 Tax=Portunus trituberculatus TaxID=210409 RepID=A0A5B7DSH1_PORTR|nr:hypothetical protein [Portunus trituberculatus]